MAVVGSGHIRHWLGWHSELWQMHTQQFFERVFNLNLVNILLWLFLKTWTLFFLLMSSLQTVHTRHHINMIFLFLYISPWQQCHKLVNFPLKFYMSILLKPIQSRTSSFRMFYVLWFCFTLNYLFERCLSWIYICC